MKAAGDDVGVLKANRKIRMLREKYDMITQKAGLDPHYDRMSVPRTAKSVDFLEKKSIIKTESERMTINSIEFPIEQKHTGKGNPNAVLIFGTELNRKQKTLINNLPDFNSRVSVNKKSVSMTDLATLTAQTGDEFAMFTKGNERLVIRGNKQMVDIDIVEAQKLASEGYKWSGHTHPGTDFLSMQPSDGDYAILMCFNQSNAVIYNSKGDYRIFEKRSE